MLSLVPTPIGNLKDITLRALDVLKGADLILCENPHHSQRLLKEYEIHKPTKQWNQFSNEKLAAEVIDLLKADKHVAYISDAGMPGISDPGHDLILLAQQFNVAYTVLPGANAVLPALVASGFAQKEFYFAGFLPLKKGRKKQLQKLLELTVPVVLYESPYRVNKLLSELILFNAGSKSACIVRELSKIYEECIRGTVQELSEKYRDRVWKGEFVIILNVESRMLNRQ